MNTRSKTTDAFFVVVFLMVCGSVVLTLNSANADPSETQLHKIVDKDGNITYSQFPPIESERAVATRNAESSASAVETRHGRYYCGDIYLAPVDSSQGDIETFFTQLRVQKSRWQQRLNRVNQEFLTISESQFQRNKAASARRESDISAKNSYDDIVRKDLLRQATDLKCAIAWSERQQQDHLIATSLK